MKAQVQALYCQYGMYETNDGRKEPYANLYTITEPVVSPEVVGVKPGKMPIFGVDGRANHDLARRIMAKMTESKTFPVTLNVSIGQKVTGGQMSMTVIDLH